MSCGRRGLAVIPASVTLCWSPLLSRFLPRPSPCSAQRSPAETADDFLSVAEPSLRACQSWCQPSKGGDLLSHPSPPTRVTAALKDTSAVFLGHWAAGSLCWENVVVSRLEPAVALRTIIRFPLLLWLPPAPSPQLNSCGWVLPGTSCSHVWVGSSASLGPAAPDLSRGCWAALTLLRLFSSPGRVKLHCR